MFIRIRRSLYLAVFLGMIGANSAVARDWVDYDQSLFAAAQAAGRAIVVDVTAEWCSTCKQQQPILAEIAQRPELNDALLIKVDFDAEKEFLKTHRIPRQSTILVFQGERETARSVAETDSDRLTRSVLEGLTQG